MRISDWSSDVCSSDLRYARAASDEPIRPARIGSGTRELASAVTDTARHKLTSIAACRISMRSAPPHHNQEMVAHVAQQRQIGRASCRARVCQYVSISVVAVSLQKKTNNR